MIINNSCVVIAANTSNYSAEEQLTANVWVHTLPQTGRTVVQVMTAFHEQFNKVPLRKVTLLDWQNVHLLLEVSRTDCGMDKGKCS
jgi:hypothetical protein